MTQEILMVAFGGPTEGCCGHFDECPGEAYCFVSGIFGHNPARKARIDEVAAHYTALGGFSRFNEITMAQAEALQAELAKRGVEANVRCGFDHWAPHIADKVAEIANDGAKDFLAMVMSPHQSSVSWDGYLRRISEGLDALDGNKPEWTGVTDPFWNAEGFVDALAARATEAQPEGFGDASVGLLMSAHSVPEPVAKTAPYVNQIVETAKLVAEKLGAANHVVGFQSAPEDSRIPWTTPFLPEAIATLKEQGATRVVGLPIGFLCDNVEVAYDLGIEGREASEQAGLTFALTEAVNTHPAFIAMLADRVQAKLG